MFSPSQTTPQNQKNVSAVKCFQNRSGPRNGVRRSGTQFDSPPLRNTMRTTTMSMLPISPSTGPERVSLSNDPLSSSIQPFLTRTLHVHLQCPFDESNLYYEGLQVLQRHPLHDFCRSNLFTEFCCRSGVSDFFLRIRFMLATSSALLDSCKELSTSTVASVPSGSTHEFVCRHVKPPCWKTERGSSIGRSDVGGKNTD